MGNTYRDVKGVFQEEKSFILVLTGPLLLENWNVEEQPSSFFYFKGIINQVLRKMTLLNWNESASKSDLFSEGLCYKIQDKVLGNFGILKKELLNKFDIDQEVLFAEIDFNLLTELVRSNKIIYQDIPKFPRVRRDFALMLDMDVQFDQIKKIALDTEENILHSVALFDVYQGEKLPKGKKSYGVSFHFQDSRRTLTDKHIDKIMEKLSVRFEKELGAKLR